MLASGVDYSLALLLLMVLDSLSVPSHAACCHGNLQPFMCLQNTQSRRAVVVKAAVATQAAEAPAKVAAGSSAVSGDDTWW